MLKATAILIFAQPVGHDAAHKRLVPRLGPNQLAFRRLNEYVDQTAAATGLLVLRSADLIPHTGTFGEQITSALQATFALGFERVVVIGNDCPSLTTAHLTRAAEQLQSVPVVLGPDQRGGLYLLGLSRNAFDPGLLASMPWQTGRLASAVQRMNGDHSVSLLPRLGDVNSRADLRQYRATSSAVASFVARLLGLEMRNAASFTVHQSIRLTGVCVGSGPLRAPPAGCAATFAA